MNDYKIDKQYPELKGISPVEQERILYKIKKETNSLRHEMVSVFIAIVVFVIYKLVQPAILSWFPPTYWIGIMVAATFGLIFGIIKSIHDRCYVKKLRGIIKELLSSQRNSDGS